MELALGVRVSGLDSRSSGSGMTGIVEKAADCSIATLIGMTVCQKVLDSMTELELTHRDGSC